jgi:hypothetical protein
VKGGFVHQTQYGNVRSAFRFEALALLAAAHVVTVRPASCVVVAQPTHDFQGAPSNY